MRHTVLQYSVWRALSQLASERLLSFLWRCALIRGRAAERSAASFCDKRECCLIGAFLSVSVNTHCHAMWGRWWAITLLQTTHTHTPMCLLNFSHVICDNSMWPAFFPQLLWDHWRKEKNCGSTVNTQKARLTSPPQKKKRQKKPDHLSPPHSQHANDPKQKDTVNIAFGATVLSVWLLLQNSVGGFCRVWDEASRWGNNCSGVISKLLPKKETHSNKIWWSSCR